MAEVEPRPYGGMLRGFALPIAFYVHRHCADEPVAAATPTVSVSLLGDPLSSGYSLMEKGPAVHSYAPLASPRSARVAFSEMHTRRFQAAQMRVTKSCVTTQTTGRRRIFSSAYGVCRSASHTVSRSLGSASQVHASASGVSLPLCPSSCTFIPTPGHVIIQKCLRDPAGRTTNFCSRCDSISAHHSEDCTVATRRSSVWPITLAERPALWR